MRDTNSEAPDRLIVPVLSDKGADFLVEFDTYLQGQNFLPIYVPESKELELAISKYVDSDRIESGLSDHSPEQSLQTLTNRFGINSPRSVVSTEMAYDYKYPKPSYTQYFLSSDKVDFDTYIDKLHRCLDFISSLYQENGGGTPLQYPGGEILRRSLQFVADCYGHESIWAGFSPVNGMTGFYNREDERWESIEKAAYHEMSDDEVKQAELYIHQVRNDNTRIDSNPPTDTFLKDIQQKFQLIRRYNKNIAPYVMRWVRGHLFKPVLAWYAKRQYMAESESKEILAGDDFVFYPLQYYRESRVLVRAPSYYNQTWLVEYLSRSLPTNHQLVVKDHPRQLGAQPRSSVDTITNYSNAIAPGIPTNLILSNASVVVVLNNTVGYEAIMHGKPVVALGDGFYTSGDYTYSPKTINDLAETINKASKSDGIPEEKVIEFTHGLLNGSYPGEWGNTDDDNLSSLSKSVRQFYTNP